ncbi:DUF4129 domain-containing protein [Roseibacillus ishigakijimensis]|uniref:DUF4129 domain-containing protein n=1 Tax=Roseibacillus ishigakijimensis TaxID=454146 RepID=A0A934RNX8_9BACT|nr:hypothetical protein [Roseibacillus ishigakijimensis]MBK1832871.1 hypothetical protein [Roseibacillus ishigakijimensis]
MNVRDLTVSLRPRTAWEAVDLGTELARHSYRDLFRIGWKLGTPPALLLALLCWFWPWLFPLLLWWGKPLLDRFYLFYLSRRIFGQEVTVRQTLGQWRSLLFRGSLPLLTWRRFSPSRSMTLPVTDLENLHGPARSQRCATVTRMGGGQSVLVTAGGAILELIGLATVILLALFFVPQGQDLSQETWQTWFDRGGTGPTLLTLALGLSYGFLVLLLEPFYLASGFALYLNSRINQEAWDIELRFRELASRVREKASSAAAWFAPVLLLFAFCGGGELSAQGPDPQTVVAEVLADDEFKIRTRTEREWIPPEGSWWEGFFDWLGGLGAGAEVASGFGEILFFFIKVLALVLLVVVLLVLAIRLVTSLSDREGSALSKKRARPAPRVVLGMEVTPESLPADLLGEARRHWQAGDSRLALSLLYRGALTHLITAQAVPIESSSTENECLAEVESHAPVALGSYFAHLSGQWMKEAYSRERVTGEDFETLCQGWPFERRPS